ncbi:2-amino-4-hydroxy-6-hydroxymethyldihydropteridine diphosphokinase [candidate division FCPU426 bacterium]|nr:2-amino-4-hydroxy-6-hydroxymethyldihydropteridine diphosphokinase [candidate division FCPU426 bacterium]
MHRVYLGLGANLGNPREQLRWAVGQLNRAQGMKVVQVSSLYQTIPVGGGPQPDYLNAAVAAQTSKAPREVLKQVLALEEKIGRVRITKNAPRLLDIDVLLYNNAIIAEPDLQVPHYDLARRAFVLVPLAEIAPRLQHPVCKQTMGELLGKISRAGTRCIAAGSGWAGLDKEFFPWKRTATS